MYGYARKVDRFLDTVVGKNYYALGMLTTDIENWIRRLLEWYKKLQSRILNG